MKRLAVALMLGAVCIQPVAARAADWPTRPIRIIAPSTPGGAADMFARLLCEQFSETLHERCFVENRAGAGGLIGTAATAQAAPDGYTLTTSSTAYHVIAPVVNPNPGFDPLKDFTHIAYVGGPPNVFVVNPALGVRSLADLVALGRRGQAIDYVSPGSGTLGQLLAEFPDLPTFKDLGYDDLTAVSWFALSGPAGLPKDITQRLNATVATMLERPEVRKRLERDSIETRAMTSEEFTQFVAGEIAKWTPVARRVMQAN